MKQNKLTKRITSSAKVSNLFLLLKIIFDLLPQVLIVHMITFVFSNTLTIKIIAIDCSFLLLSYLVKANFSYLATWKAHNNAYSFLADLRYEIIEHLKKLPLGFLKKKAPVKLQISYITMLNKLRFIWLMHYRK